MNTETGKEILYKWLPSSGWDNLMLDMSQKYKSFVITDKNKNITAYIEYIPDLSDLYKRSECIFGFEKKLGELENVRLADFIFEEKNIKYIPGFSFSQADEELKKKQEAKKVLLSQMPEEQRKILAELLEIDIDE